MGVGSFFTNMREGIRKLQEIDYAGLEGLPGSFAREAGERALAGEVPVHCKDGKYDVATFAGGCFWGTELHFQRMPGVIATCVGYTQGEVRHARTRRESALGLRRVHGSSASPRV
jgi:hypothetical protein